MKVSVLSLAALTAMGFSFQHCATANPTVRIANGSIETPDGTVTLGATLEQWKKQWGAPDSFSFGVAVWPKWGLDINYSVNACAENRVTAFTVYSRTPEGSDLPSTRLPIRLEDCSFRYDDRIQGDTLKCGNRESKNPLMLIADTEPKPSEIFFRSRIDSGSSQRKKTRSFKYTSDDGLISLEVDTIGRMMRLDYGLSNEQAYRIGLERSPQEQKAFADSGKCAIIPNLWEP